MFCRVPIIALVVLFFLHRRYKKKLRAEDQQDAEKYKSMDFGMDLTYNDGSKKGRKGPKAASPPMDFNTQRQLKGLSLDPGHNPFFLDSQVNQSKPSIDEDPYTRAVTSYSSRSNSPMPSAHHAPIRRTTTESTSTTHRFDSNANLMSHAQSPAMSPPARGDSFRPRGDSLSSGVNGPIRPRGASISSKMSHSSPLAQDNGFDGKPAPGSIVEQAYPQAFPQPPSLPEPAKTNTYGLGIPQSNDPRDRDSYFDKNAQSIRNSNNYLSDFFTDPKQSQETASNKSHPSSYVASHASTGADTYSTTSLKTPLSSIADDDMLPPVPAVAKQYTDPPTQSVEHRVDTDNMAFEAPQLPKHQSFEASLHNYTPSFVSDTSNYNDVKSPRESSLPSVPEIRSHPPRGESLVAAMPSVDEYEHEPQQDGYLNDYYEQPQPGNRMSVLLRPLPAEDPAENPEERANRIRSFYKEYFDGSEPLTSQVPLPRQQEQAAYYEDYSSEYLNGGTVFDPETGGFVVAAAPFAQPITRRAMTPPPRAPPRFQSHGGSRSRSRATSNVGSQYSQYLQPPPPRGHSSMSNRGRLTHKKPLPPPSPLSSLPTPHMLKDDSAIFNATDFAPPVSMRDLQAGRRPDSPYGSERPYSPSVRAFVPLQSSFEDLNAMPSPHMLRKSGAFTGLDFAPPQRFRNTDAGSDASSIRSGRSGMSQAQLHNLRAGAYRISRVPKELVGTKDDITSSLKPQWDMTRPA